MYEKILLSFTVRDIDADILTIRHDPELTVADAQCEMNGWEGLNEIAIIENGNKDIGYIDIGDEYGGPDDFIDSWMQPISPSQIVSESLPIADLVPLFLDNYFYFVLRKNRVGGVVSYNDLDKSPFKLALFSQLIALETAMADGIKHDEKDIQYYLSLLSKKRQRNAEKILIERNKYARHKGQDVCAAEMFECTCFADKKTIYLKEAILFNRLGFTSKIKASKFLTIAENLRNQIAHGQTILTLFGHGRDRPSKLASFLQALSQTINALK